MFQVMLNNGKIESKASGPNLVPDLNRAPKFKCYVVRHGCKTNTKIACVREGLDCACKF